MAVHLVDLDEYQKSAMSFAGDLVPLRTAEEMLAHAGLFTAAFGMAGEAGEFSDHVKKWLAQGHDLDLDQLDKEVGDVLWYAARYAEWRKKSLSEFGRKNIQKLSARYPDGFSTERSVNRETNGVLNGGVFISLPE